MRKKYFLIDYDKGKASERQHQLYMMAARMSIKYGRFGRDFGRCNEDMIRECWRGNGDIPTFTYFRKKVKVSTVKWYIHNEIDLSDQDWNGDFIHGMATSGHIRWNRHTFPSLTWYSNRRMYSLLDTSPFGGFLKEHTENRLSWVEAPSLYLNFSETSASYIAGLLAIGILCEKDGMTYAQYHRTQKRFLLRFGFPIEHVTKSRQLLISPFWPALFALKMPEEIREYWKNISNPFGVNEYAPILWKTYANNKFPRGGIPYLKSRRWIFRHYKSERGAMRTLEMLRVEKRLADLDGNVRGLVHAWNKLQE